ncbi:MAG TPA: glycoside hydrolase family 44 protein [Rudaea sp.]
MRGFALLLLLAGTAADAATTLPVYTDALQSGFTDGSWQNSPAGSRNLAATSPVYGGSGKSIQYVARAWNGLQFVASGSEYNFADYQSVTFQVNGGTAGAQKLQMYLCDNYSKVGNVYPVNTLLPGSAAIPKNAWAQATLDFDAAHLTFGTFNCIVIMDGDGGNDTASGQSAVYVDQIVFNPRAGGPPSGGAVNVAVQLTTNVHPVDPNIFGVAFGDAARNAQMRYSVIRWGGNSTSRYNWRGPGHNSGSDYFYLGYGSDQTDDADAFVSAARNAGAQPLIAVPTIGWVQKFNAADPTHVSWGFSQAKYGPQTLDECRFYATPPPWCHGDAGNGECNGSINKTGFCVGGLIVGNDPADTSIANAPSDDAAWIAHLKSTFGSAAAGGVKLYSLDNEVMLWNSTHRDVHPEPPSYDEIWNKTLTYATAIKNADPDALVTGPVTWGYCDLFTAADDVTPSDCVDGPDRTAHGGLPFVAWWLQQVCAHPLAGGKRLVDYLDLHFYPQGANVALNDDDSAATAALRLRSVKELYDPNYVSESWIGGAGAAYNKPHLIPRVRAWIDQYCPGTKLAITEYNWGNDGTASGAVAQAEVLGIFARDGVDLATRWVAPGPNTRAERAFTIFRNYDGAGSAVQGDSVGATSSALDQIGAYAFRFTGQRIMVLLTNKDTLAHDVNVALDSARKGHWSLYGFDAAQGVHAIGTGGDLDGATLIAPALPPMSATLLVLPDDDDIFRNGFDVGV